MPPDLLSEGLEVRLANALEITLPFRQRVGSPTIGLPNPREPKFVSCNPGASIRWCWILITMKEGPHLRDNSRADIPRRHFSGQARLTGTPSEFSTDFNKLWRTSRLTRASSKLRERAD